MGSESESVHSMNPLPISDVVKKLLTTFFSANVPFVRGLDIYGSIHVRSDDSDIVCCVLNEHCFKPDRLTSPEDRESVPLLSVSGPVSGQQGTGQPNTANEYMPEWMGQAACEKRGRKSAEQKRGDATENDVEMQAKRKKLPGLSRKLSKLKGSALSMHYSVQSVFPEPLAFGGAGGGSSGNAEDEKFQVEGPQEVKRLVADDGTEDESADGRGPQKSEDPNSSDEPSIDLAMAATSEVDTPQKCGLRFEGTCETDMADLDSGESHDFEQTEKPGVFPFGSQQSFNHSTPFSGFSVPHSFSESEIFSQSAWLPTDGTPRGGNQIVCPDAGFDGSTKGPGPLTSEKICMYCLKIFHTNLEMSQHIQQQHNSGFPFLENTDERPYRPRYQNTYAYGGSELDVDRQLTCSVCSLAFRSLDGLRCHENSKHSRNKLYKCQFCTQSFLTRQAAYTHRMKFHRLIPRKPQLLAGPMTPI